MKYILMVKILLYANVGILICNDASLKTATCKVPEIIGMTYINGAYVVQAIPMQYPTSTNYDIKLYVFPIICVDGYTQTHSNNTNTFIITKSIIQLSKSPGPTTSDDVYMDSDNPITCRYWYISI